MVQQAIAPSEQEESLHPVRYLLTAYAVSQLGNWLFRAGVIYEAYNKAHGSTAVLAAAILMVYLPILTGSRLLAPLVDRWNTKTVLISLDVGRAIMLCGLLVVTISWHQLVAASALTCLGLLSLLSPMFAASQTAYLRRRLHGDSMPKALAALSKIDWSTFVLGTAAGPIVLQATNVPELVLIDIATFVVSAMLLLNLRPAPPHRVAWDGHSAGNHRYRLSVETKQILLGIFLLNVGAGLINVYPNVVARDFLRGGAGILGLINLVDGLGALVGATVAGKWKPTAGRRPIYWAAVLVALSLAAMAGARFVVVALVASAAMLLGGQVFAVSAQSRMLRNEPAQHAGRISGYFTMATFGGVMMSTLAFPVATHYAAIGRSFPFLLLGGAVMTAVSALLLRGLRQPSEADQAEPEPPRLPEPASLPEMPELLDAAGLGQAGADLPERAVAAVIADQPFRPPGVGANAGARR